MLDTGGKMQDCVTDFLHTVHFPSEPRNSAWAPRYPLMGCPMTQSSPRSYFCCVWMTSRVSYNHWSFSFPIMLTWLGLLQMTACVDITSDPNWPNTWALPVKSEKSHSTLMVTYSNTEVHEYDLLTIDVTNKHMDLGIRVTTDIKRVDRWGTKLQVARRDHFRLGKALSLWPETGGLGGFCQLADDGLGSV